MANENHNKIQAQDQKDSARNGAAVFFEGVYYGQVPVDLLHDPKIKLQAKGIYALLHSYSQPKDLILCRFSEIRTDHGFS